MPMSDEDYQVFQKHLGKQGKFMLNSACPVCENQTWMTHGPVEMPVLFTRAFIDMRPVPAGVKVNQEVFEAALLICTRCYFVRPFAWLPIKNGGHLG